MPPILVAVVAAAVVAEVVVVLVEDVTGIMRVGWFGVGRDAMLVLILAAR